VHNSSNNLRTGDSNSSEVSVDEVLSFLKEPLGLFQIPVCRKRWASLRVFMANECFGGIRLVKNRNSSASVVSGPDHKCVAYTAKSAKDIARSSKRHHLKVPQEEI
jgi:hypothetical protein